jgi:diketogulonate reductase-like aldo/keto reductase
MGEANTSRSAEVTAVRAAIDMGYRLIDTAEMYGEGGAETVVGLALAEALRAGAVKREELVVVSKVYPHNASRRGTVSACERSRQRLGLDRIDVYLLHWRGSHPLAETVEAMESLVQAGHIGSWGVSNFDVDDMQELSDVITRLGASACATNQVYFSLSERGPEFSLLPWMRERAMPLMAYSPIDQGALAADAGLQQIARRLGITAAQLALAWVLAQAGVVAIPKAVRAAHLRDNLAAAARVLDPDVLAEIDRLHPAPRRKKPLAMI